MPLLSAIYAANDRGSNLAAADVIYIEDSGGNPYGIDITDLFGNIPVPVLAEVSDTILGTVEIIKESANTELILSCYHDTEATTPLITMRKAGGSLAAPALVDDNAVLGTWSFEGYDGSGWHEGARIEARIQGTPSDGADMPTELTFWTTPDGSGSPVQRAAIDPDGHITGFTAGSWALQNVEASATVPVFAIGTATTTGIGGDDGTPYVSGIVSGAEIWRTKVDSFFTESGIYIGTNALVNGSPILLAEVATATNPVFSFFGIGGTGIGGAYNAVAANAYVSAIVDSTEIARFTKTYADCKFNLFINTPTLAGNLANGLAMKNGTAGSVSMTDSVQLWAADAGGLAGHSGLHMRGEDDASNLVVVGYKEESADAETPQAAATPGTVCKFTDSGDASGNGVYQLALDGTTWNQLA